MLKCINRSLRGSEVFVRQVSLCFTTSFCYSSSSNFPSSYSSFSSSSTSPSFFSSSFFSSFSRVKGLIFYFPFRTCGPSGVSLGHVNPAAPSIIFQYRQYHPLNSTSSSISPRHVVLQTGPWTRGHQSWFLVLVPLTVHLHSAA